MHSVPASIQRGAVGYQVGNSIVLNNESSQFLSRTPSNAGNSGRLTISVWHKRGRLSDDGAYLIGAATDAQNYTHLGFERFGTKDRLRLYGKASNTDTYGCSADGLNRDPADWEHVVMAFDRDQAANEDRSALFINGVQQLVNPASNTNTGYSFFNRVGVPCQIGNSPAGGLLYYDGYIAEVVMVDGFYLPPTAFGEWNANAPDVWQPIDLTDGHIDYSGANSFHLDFADPNDLGKDVSGKGNSFTVNNISSANHVTDTPTNNVAVMNSVGLYGVYRDGNRYVSRDTVVTSSVSDSTVKMTTGKWYFEGVVGSTNTGFRIGIHEITESYGESLGQHPKTYGYRSDGRKYNNNVDTNYGASFNTVGAVIGVAFDADAGTIEFFINNVSQTIAFTGIPAGSYGAAVSFGNTSDNWTMHFNEDELTYAPPADHLALMAKNLPEPVIRDPKEYFDPVIYTGNAAASRTIITRNKVDHVITKRRDSASSWRNYDVARGATKQMVWDDNFAESDQLDGVLAFGAASGYDIGDHVGLNANGGSYVAYPFTNNPIAGMEMVLYTGNGVNRAIPHSLGVTPEFMIVKKRDGSTGWTVYHKAITATDYMYIDTNATAASSVNVWNDTEPTALDFTVGVSGIINAAGDDYIAYLFASVAGFSKVFSYTGNLNVDGPFVNCDFKPAFVLIKNTTTNGMGWMLFDIKRSTYNPVALYLNPDTTAAEGAGFDMDFLSNGFKIRSAGNQTNANGVTHIGIAFAENPFGMRGR